MSAIEQISAELRTLRALSSGRVVARGEDGYEEARLAWNLAAPQRPAAIAFPETSTDVAFAVGFARDAGLRVNVQGTGHNANPLGEMADTLLIRTNRMTGVEIDAAGRRARVQAGALWQDVVPKASAMGLAALHGSSPDVGIVGYSLGGGIGYLARRYGIQTNSVTAIELVTADGELVETTAEREPELFWALRGGGGNFGVVTAIEFKLYPVESVYAGMMIWPWERGHEVLSRWAEWTQTVPDEVTSMARLMQIPDMDGVPDFLRGRQIAVINAAYLGDEEEGRRIFAPLRELEPDNDLFGMMPAVGLSSLHGDPEEPVPGASDGLLLDALPPEAIDTVMAEAGPGSDTTLLMTELRHLGGAVGRARPEHGALARIDGEYLLFAGGLAADPEMGAAVQRDATALVDAMSPYGRGRRYLNFTEHRVDTRVAYPAEVYERLQRVRERWDPDFLFNANHQIA